MSIKKVLASIRKADEMFNLIQDKDRIAVGVSGGKDSILLLYCLKLYKYLAKNSLNKDFDYIGVHIDLNFGQENDEKLKKFIKDNEIPYYEEESKIKDILELNKKNDEIQCSLCSTLKKGAVVNAAKKLNCNKVAFGHHADDAIETLFLNMIYGGRINTFDPIMHLENANVDFIRPLILTYESDISKTCKELDIPTFKSGCPNDGYTKREEIKKLLHSIYHTYPSAKENFLLSLLNDDKVNILKGIKQK